MSAPRALLLRETSSCWYGEGREEETQDRASSARCDVSLGLAEGVATTPARLPSRSPRFCRRSHWVIGGSYVCMHLSPSLPPTCVNAYLSSVICHPVVLCLTLITSRSAGLSFVRRPHTFCDLTSKQKRSAVDLRSSLSGHFGPRSKGHQQWPKRRIMGCPPQSSNTPSLPLARRKAMMATLMHT